MGFRVLGSKVRVLGFRGLRFRVQGLAVKIRLTRGYWVMGKKIEMTLTWRSKWKRGWTMKLELRLQCGLLGLGYISHSLPPALLDFLI